MASRHKAREYALQLLYQVDLRKDEVNKLSPGFFDSVEAAEEEQEYAQSLVSGVVIHKADLDELIEKKAVNWRMARMSVIDRNILRLGAYEIVHKQDVPRGK